mgnify:CR=1 FL=1
MLKNLQPTTYNQRSLFLIVSRWSLVVGSGLLIPVIVSAAPENFKALINVFISIINVILPLVYGLSFLYFFWGIAKYIFSAGSEEQKKEAKNVMTWGLIAIFVLTSFFGILKLFGGAFFPNMSQYGAPQPTYEGIDRSDESWRNIVDPNTGLPFPNLQDPRYMGGGGI